MCLLVQMHIPRDLKQFASIFFEHNYQCFLVGGAVRNMVARRKVTDFDFATDALPEQVMRLYPRVVPTGIKHGTVTVLYKHHHFEVTTFRVEGTYSDSRRPDTVVYIPSIYEDLKRRDFTINSMALNLSNNVLLDPHNGKVDIKNSLIRAIGNPVERFDEDGLRILRACRFASQLNFTIHHDTLSGMHICRDKLLTVSAERIRDEVKKILLSDKPSIAFRIMDDTAILDLLFPELSACKNVEQQGYHEFDVFEHLLRSCDHAKKEVPLRLAALFHDIGKPQAMQKDADGNISFHRHEHISEKLALAIIRRLKFPKVVEKETTHLIRHHMFNYQENWSDAAVRRFLHRVGVHNVDNLLYVRKADQLGMGLSRKISPAVDEFRRRIRDVLENDAALTVKDLAVDGTVLHEKCGIPKGPEMGQVLEFLLEAVLDDPDLNVETTLLDIGKKYYSDYIEKKNKQ